MKVNLFLALSFPLFLGILIGVDERVGFCSYSGSRIRHHTPSDVVTRAIDRIFEKNLRFHVKYCSKKRVQYLVFSNSLLVLTVLSFWGKNWALKSCIVWQHVSQLAFTIFISNNHVPFHLLWKKLLVKSLQVSKYYDHCCKFQKWHSCHGAFNSKKIHFNYIINRIGGKVTKIIAKSQKKNKALVKGRFFRF